MSYTRIKTQVWNLKMLPDSGQPERIAPESFDVVHFFGGINTGLLIACLKYFGLRSRTFYSPVKRPAEILSFLRRRAMKAAFGRVDRIIATTNYVRDGWSLICGKDKCSTLHPGIFKEIPEPSEHGTRESVLFWRNADYRNGADIAMEAFQELALKYTDVRFVFAVRPHDVLEKKLLELEKRIANIDVHIYPYKKGINLVKLLQNALFVVQPFRSLSINPQISIMETLYAGVPVIATRIESNEELIKENQTGLLIPPNDRYALSRAIERLLQDRKLLEKIAKNAQLMTKERWSSKSFSKKLVSLYENT